MPNLRKLEWDFTFKEAIETVSERLSKAHMLIRDSKVQEYKIMVHWESSDCFACEDEIAVLNDEVVSALAGGDHLRSLTLHFKRTESTQLTGKCFSAFVPKNTLIELKVIRSHPTGHFLADLTRPTLESYFHHETKQSTQWTMRQMEEPLFTAEGLSNICQLTNLQTLFLNFLRTDDMKLSELSQLTSLTHLSLTLAESFDQISLPPVWIASLPTSLKTLFLRCFSNIICCHENKKNQCTLKIARTFEDCLPYLGHLTRLTSLSCILTGTLSSKSLSSLPSRALRELAFGQSPHTKPGSIEVSASTVNAFSQFPSLRNVVFLVVRDAHYATSQPLCSKHFADRLRDVRSSTGSRFSVQEETLELRGENCRCEPS